MINSVIIVPRVLHATDAAENGTNFLKRLVFVQFLSRCRAV